MEQPKKDENWHVRYGANVKTNVIVKVLKDEPEHGLKNWYQDSFKCDRLGEVVYVTGHNFVERF